VYDVTMATQKLFTSLRKLDSLPTGSQIRFGTAPYGWCWRKTDQGWLSGFSSWPIPWDAKTVLAYQVKHGGLREYSVDRVGPEKS
jgi:hypothetical protein